VHTRIPVYEPIDASLNSRSRKSVIYGIDPIPVDGSSDEPALHGL